jgi:hypothetical protein
MPFEGRFASARVRILLFLKKKKQKDFFGRCAAGARHPGWEREPPMDKSLFCFFFLQKKEDSSLP